MVEWLLLAGLVPAIVVPVVLLYGFAGCHLVFGVEPPPGSPLVDVTATPLGASAIRLAWTTTPDVDQVRITGSPEGDGPHLDVVVDGSPYDDTGLFDETTYFYELTPVIDGADGKMAEVSATTPAAVQIFATTLTQGQSNQAGRCLVQRIEGVRLSASAERIRLTIAAPTTGDVRFVRITISTAGPGYDSATPPVNVATDVFVAAGTSVTLPPVGYVLDEQLPLLLAFDVGMPGNLAFLPNAPAVDASAFLGDVHAAGLADRPDGFVPRDRIYVVERIEAV